MRCTASCAGRRRSTAAGSTTCTANASLHLHYGDLTDGVSLANLIREITPHEVYNLGAQSHVQGLLRGAGVHRVR